METPHYVFSIQACYTVSKAGSKLKLDSACWYSTYRRAESVEQHKKQEGRTKPDRNAQGGVSLSDAEIEAAFAYLACGRDTLTRADLTRALQNLVPGFSYKDVKELVSEGGLDLDSLKELLHDNALRSDDPYAELFESLDLSGTGYADERAIKAAVESSPAVGTVSDDEVKHLIRKADYDGDGKLSLMDIERISPELVSQAAESRPRTSGGELKEEELPSSPAAASPVTAAINNPPGNEVHPAMESDEPELTVDGES